MGLILDEKDKEAIEFVKLQLEKCILKDDAMELIDNNYITAEEYHNFIKGLIDSLYRYDVPFGSNLAKFIHNMFTVSTESKNEEIDPIVKDIKYNQIVIFDLMVCYKVLILLFMKNKLIHNKKEDILKLKEIALELIKGYLKSINQYKKEKELEVINNLETNANEYMIKVISMKY